MDELVPLDKNVGEWLDSLEGGDLVDFTPSNEQQLCKSRFWQMLRQSPATQDPTLLSISQMAKLSGAGTSFRRWASKGPFLFWFLDEKFDSLRIDSMFYDLVTMLYDVAMSETIPKELTAKDKIAAANLLFQVGDRFPNKRREVVYIDKELGKMNEVDVERQLAETKQLLESAEEKE